MNTWFEYPPRAVLEELLAKSPALCTAVWLRDDAEPRMATAAGVTTLRVPCLLCLKFGVSGSHAKLKRLGMKDGSEIWIGGCSNDDCPAITWGVADAELVQKRDVAEKIVEDEMKKEIADAKAGKNLGIIGYKEPEKLK